MELKPTNLSTRFFTFCRLHNNIITIDFFIILDSGLFDNFTASFLTTGDKMWREGGFTKKLTKNLWSYLQHSIPTNFLERNLCCNISHVKRLLLDIAGQKKRNILRRCSNSQLSSSILFFF